MHEGAGSAPQFPVFDHRAFQAQTGGRVGLIYHLLRSQGSVLTFLDPESSDQINRYSTIVHLSVSLWKEGENTWKAEGHNSTTIEEFSTGRELGTKISIRSQFPWPQIFGVLTYQQGRPDRYLVVDRFNVQNRQLEAFNPSESKWFKISWPVGLDGSAVVNCPLGIVRTSERDAYIVRKFRDNNGGEHLCLQYFIAETDQIPFYVMAWPVDFNPRPNAEWQSLPCWTGLTLIVCGSSDETVYCFWLKPGGREPLRMASRIRPPAAGWRFLRVTTNLNGGFAAIFAGDERLIALDFATLPDEHEGHFPESES